MTSSGGDTQLKLEERFVCTRRLKASNQVESWLAEDTSTGKQVFVKLAHPGRVGLSNRLRIAHESRILHQLRTSSLAKLVRFGESEELVYLVTEYVPGEDLEQLLSHGPLDQKSSITIGVRLLQALEEVHGQNILHRDIKPSNIKVPSPDRATLVDFGLSGSRDGPFQEFGGVTGSLLYMAPEQLGLLSREISPATDLYSLGVVLFECLAGRPPFWSDSLSDLLRKHLTQAPPALSRLRGDISERFERFIQRLLKKEPQERFVTATTALKELQAFQERLEGRPQVVMEVAGQGFRQVHAPFVGRREQKKRLDGALEETLAGMSPAVGVSGEAGSGKTRLLDSLALQAVKKGFTVYRGRGEAASSGPFSLLGGIIDKIGGELGQESDRLNRLRASLGEQAPVLAATFPSLRLLSEPQTEEQQTPWLESKIFRALRSLFRQISSSDRPALIIMDDIQWADAATRRFVLFWNAELKHARDSHSLLVVGMRPGEEVVEVGSSCSVEIELPPFTSADIEELFAALGATIGVSELAVIKELTAGNPLMVVETLREISGTAEGGTLNQKLAGLRTEGLFSRRLGRVSDSTRRLLQLAAQLGQSFQPLGLGYASGLNDTEVFQCLAESRAESIVWEDATTGKYYFIHDRIRQHLSEALEEHAKTELHLRYARYLTQEMPDNHYDLAFHYHLAGEYEEASGYAVAAARGAIKRNALETAIFYFEIAMKDPRYSRDVKLREELADCCMLTGEYPKALELYKSTYKHHVQKLDRARLLGKLGELHQKMGHVGDASRVILQAIELLGNKVPSSALGRRMETGWRLAVELIKPSEKVRAGSENDCPRSLLLAHLYSRLSYVWFWTHGQADLLFIHLRHLQQAARHPGSRELAQAYASHAIACIGAHQLERARRFAQLSLDLRREIRDAWGEAHAYNTLGIVLYAASRVDECIEVVSRAETLLDATGDLWELAVCRYNLALCYYRKGQLPRAREPARRAYAVGLECGDVQASGVSLGVMVRCSPLEVSEDQLDRELNAPDLDSATKAWLLEAKGIRWLALGQASKAVRVLEESWSISEELGRRTEYVASTPCWLATAYRERLETLSPFVVQEREALLGKLEKTVGLALRWTRNFRNNLAHALREEAYFQALRGNSRAAVRALGESLEVAEELGFLQELALTTKAQLRLKDALSISAENIGRFSKPLLDYGKLLDYGSHQSISQLERFQQVLDVAAKLTKADSYEAVFEVMRRSAGALFRTEDCLVLELVDDTLQVVNGDDRQAVSRTLARHALEVASPATSVDDLPLTESLMMAEIRSALCIPFGSADSCRCCVQVSHQLVGQIFADEELRVASYLSALGTAALESVASTEAVKEAEELEQQRRKQLELLEARREGLLQSLGIASHDLKNLVFMVECVSRGLLDSKSREELEQAQDFLQLVCRKANWMLCIYLDITRAQKTGSIPCQPSWFDLAELARDVTEFLNHSLTLESQQPRIELRAQREVMVVGDKDRLWQAVANILANALTHTPLNSPIIVEVTRAEGRGTLAVTDQGKGISPEVQKVIFDPFVQAGEGSKGTGLGLWIAKLVVESSGGTLELDSELGTGSVFKIHLQSEPAESSPSELAV